MISDTLQNYYMRPKQTPENKIVRDGEHVWDSRCKKRLWREVGREQLESFRLAPWASRRRRDLLELLDRNRYFAASDDDCLRQEPSVGYGPYYLGFHFPVSGPSRQFLPMYLQQYFFHPLRQTPRAGSESAQSVPTV